LSPRLRAERAVGDNEQNEDGAVIDNEQNEENAADDNDPFSSDDSDPSVKTHAMQPGGGKNDL